MVSARPLRPKLGTAQAVHSESSPSEAVSALQQLTGVEPMSDGLSKRDLCKRLGRGRIANVSVKSGAHNLHMALARRFHYGDKTPTRELVLKELADGKDERGNPWDLALLLAEGTQGRILHVVLVPTVFLDDPSQYSFCLVRAFVAVLLEIDETLLKVAGNPRKPPLLSLITCSVDTSLDEGDEADMDPTEMEARETVRPIPVTVKAAVIQYMCITEAEGAGDAKTKTDAETRQNRRARSKHYWRSEDLYDDKETDFDNEDKVYDNLDASVCHVFGGLCSGKDDKGKLCCNQGSGIARDEALKSLGTVVTMQNGISFHAVHAAIDNDISFSEGVVKALQDCIGDKDSFGRTCLHIALAMPFTDRKIQWARYLAKLRPELFSVYGEVLVQDRKKKLTPIQFLSEQRDSHATRSQASYSRQSYRDTRGIELWEPAIDSRQAGLDGEANYLENLKLNTLEDDLRLLCLKRFRNSQECRKIMYTERNVKQVDFPLNGGIVSETLLGNLCKHYRIDRQLNSITIRSVQIDWEKPNPDFDVTFKWECAGNSDLYLVFKWLKHTQLVRKVFTVSVDDLAPLSTTGIWRPHSDRAIAECLSGLDLEVWDWRRFDIPCSTIKRAAGNTVKTLYLYSSGLGAVLESWSSLHGLPQFKELQEVYLTTYQGLESESDATASAESFEITLKKNFLEVNGRELGTVKSFVVSAKKSRGGTAGNNSDVVEQEANEWLRSVDEFNHYLRLVERPDAKVPIKVALIDDGVTSSFQSLDENIIHGESWAEARTQESYGSIPVISRLTTYTTSHTDHGTLMAWYIRRMCPHVQLCVAKLDPELAPASSGDDKVTFTIESVIKAINWAVEKDVDIISMSWAIDDTGSDTIRKKLSDALRNAIDNNILLFCANADKGTDYASKPTFPYSLYKDDIFCIGAADRNGRRWGLIDPKDACTYLVPGVDLDIHVEAASRLAPPDLHNTLDIDVIESTPPPTSAARMQRKQSGSSLACALAAGLAARIIHCCRVSGAKDLEIDYLRTFRGMKKALDSLYSNAGAAAAGGQWLPVSNLPTASNTSYTKTSDDRMGQLRKWRKALTKSMPPDFISPAAVVKGRMVRRATSLENGY